MLSQQFPWKEVTGAFIGAWSAFYIERTNRRRDETNREIAELTVFHALIAAKLNWLDNVKTQALADVASAKTLNIGRLPPEAQLQSLSPLLLTELGRNLALEFHVADQAAHIFFTEFETRNMLLSQTFQSLRPPERLDELRTLELRIKATSEHILEAHALANARLYGAAEKLAISFSAKYPGSSLGILRPVQRTSV